MNHAYRAALTVLGFALAHVAQAQVTFYTDDAFSGRSVASSRKMENFADVGFNDRASSVVVQGRRWEVCQDAGYAGHCMVLRPGRYASLRAMGLNDRISSARPVNTNARVDNDRMAPPPAMGYDSRRRGQEALFEVPVTRVRAVAGPVGRRCWTEHVASPQERGPGNVPGTVLGALLGGVLGHQVGGGTGRDLATVGGAVAGAVVGRNVGRSKGGAPQEVERCENTATQRADLWDVTYDFRGVSHRIQMDHAPGATLWVNARGEPRT